MIEALPVFFSGGDRRGLCILPVLLTLKNGHVDAAPVAKALRDTTFRASPDLYRWLLNQQE